jgi:hypothetical protein
MNERAAMTARIYALIFLGVLIWVALSVLPPTLTSGLPDLSGLF